MSEETTKYPVEFQIDIEGANFNNVETSIVYLQHPTMSELNKAANQQLLYNQITNYRITNFMDNDNVEYDQDDDLEDVWSDSDDEDHINDIQPLQLKIILEPIIKQKLTPVADSKINIQHPSKKYTVKLHFRIDHNINQTHDINLQQPTIKQIEQAVYNQLSNDESITYRITSIKDNTGVEFNDDDDVEDAFDDLDDENNLNAMLNLQITLTAKMTQPIPPSQPTREPEQEPVNNNENIPELHTQQSDVNKKIYTPMSDSESMYCQSFNLLRDCELIHQAEIPHDVIHIILNFTQELIWNELISNLQARERDEEYDWKSTQNLLTMSNKIYSETIIIQINRQRFAMCLKPIIMRKGYDNNVLCKVEAYSCTDIHKLRYVYDVMIENEEYDYVSVFGHIRNNRFCSTTCWFYVDVNDIKKYKTLLTLEEIIPIKHYKTNKIFWYLKIREYEEAKSMGIIFCFISVESDDDY